MIDMTKGNYLDLEQRLYVLRTHYDMCKGAQNEEILDWARFFLAWSRKAVADCGSWSGENLRTAEDFVKKLEKSKVGLTGYEILEKLMAEASSQLNREILAEVRNPLSSALSPR